MTDREAHLVVGITDGISPYQSLLLLDAHGHLSGGQGCAPRLH